MKLTDEDFAEAAAWADSQLAGLTVDQRWNLLRDLMEATRNYSEEFLSRGVRLMEESKEEWRGRPVLRTARDLNREMRKDRDPSEDREEMVRCLRREAVRDRVGPHVTRARWNRGLNSTKAPDLDRWIHTERLRDAAYPRPEGKS